MAKAYTEEISAREAAARLGLTHNAVGQWANRPGAPARREGTRLFVAWPHFARWREQQMVETARKELAPTVSLDEARTRKALAEAELAEIQVAKARGEVVAVEDSARALGVILDRLTARLRALPVRLAHLGEYVETAAAAETELIVGELSEFSDDVLEVDNNEPDKNAA